MWKKVFYIVITVILGIFVAYISYNSNQYTHIQKIVENEIKTENYSEIPKIFGGCHDSNSLLDEKSDKVDLVIYNGTAVTDLKYQDERFFRYEGCYYIYLFNVNFTYLTSSENLNKTAIVFTTDIGESYTLPFVVSSLVNSDYYVEEPQNLEEALLNGSRNITADVDSWDFMTVKLTETMANFISSHLGQEITGFKLVDHEGELIGSYEVDLNFSQEFYQYDLVQELIYEYNVYLDLYVKGENVNEASTAFDVFYEQWEEEFKNASSETGYALPYGKDFLQPAKIVWQTIGVMAIYSLIMVGFYFIFFHLAFLQGIFTKNSYKKPKSKNKTIYIPKREDK